MVILAQFTKGFPVVVHLDLLIIGFHVVANLEIADTFSSSSDVENSNDELHTPLQKSVVLETILFRNLSDKAEKFWLTSRLNDSCNQGGESEISAVASDTNKPHYLCPFTEKKTEEILSIFFTIAVLLKKIGQPFNICIPIFQSCTVFCPLTKKCTLSKNLCYENCSFIGKY